MWYGGTFFDYVEERELLTNWADTKGDDGLKEYWQDNNQTSLDGKATNILAKNT